MSSAILEFYYGYGRDQSGRTLRDILNFSDHDLEYSHDYIQWLFPTITASAFNPSASTLTSADISEFNSNPILQQNLLCSFVRMLRFYGMVYRRDGSIHLRPDFETSENGQNWLTSGNHNFLRITRILESLILLGLREPAYTFYKVLSDKIISNPTYREIITPRTFHFWRNVVHR